MSSERALPKGWYWSTLEAVRAQGKSIVSGPFGSSIGSRFFVASGVPVIRGSNLTTGLDRFREENFVFLTPEKAAEFSSCEAIADDLIFTAAGTIGQVGLIPKKSKYQKYIISNKQLRARLDVAKIDPVFAYYWFASPSMVKAIQSRNTGSTIPLINLSVLKSLPIPVPPLEAQREIAGFLSAFDDRITLLRDTNATLDAIAQALFKSWFIDFDPVRAKMEGRTPEGMDEATAALFPDSFEETELGMVPKGWQVKPIYDAARFINGAAYKAFEPNSERRGLPIIKIAELKAGVTAQTAYSDVQMPAKYLIETADILFSWSGNPDTSIDTFVWPHAPAWLNQHIFRVLANHADERSYLLQMLRHLKPVFTELARNKQTTGLGHVTVANLKTLMVVWPDESAINAFAEVGARIQQRIFSNEQQAITLATLRDTLLPRLISGGVTSKTGDLQRERIDGYQ